MIKFVGDLSYQGIGSSQKWGLRVVEDFINFL